jgi:hypothetical protein
VASGTILIVYATPTLSLGGRENASRLLASGHADRNRSKDDE